MFRYILTSITLFTTTSLWATEQTFSRDEAVSYALKHNKELKTVAHIIDTAQARRQQSGRLSNPEVGIDYLDDFAFNNERESSLGISITQSFPLTGRLTHTRDISDIEIKMAQMEALEARRTLAFETNEVFTEILTTQKQIELRNELIDLNQGFVDFISSRIETGEVSILDKHQAALELKAIEQEVSDLNRELIALKSKLSTLLGLESENRFNVTGTLDLKIEHAAYKGSMTDILQRRPDYQLAELGIDSAEANIRLAESETWSDVEISVMFEEEKNDDDPKGLETDRFFGIGVSIPLPLWNQNKGNIGEELSHRREANARLQALKLKIQNEINSYRSQLIELQKSVKSYQTEVLALAKKNAETIEKAYNNGQASLISVLKSQEQRLKFESAYLDTLSEYQKLKIQLQYATVENINF